MHKPLERREFHPEGLLLYPSQSEELRIKHEMILYYQINPQKNKKKQ